jgi:transposase
MEEKRLRRTFTKEFKVQAVELAEVIGSAKKAAEKLGIQADNIRSWRKALGRSVGGEDPRTVAQAMADVEEIKRLKKQVSELEKTNYILKKAAAFFSQDHLK